MNEQQTQMFSMIFDRNKEHCKKEQPLKSFEPGDIIKQIN